LLTWSAIRPGWVAIGALAGAVLGLALHALQQREQRRRESVGEI
jgi:HAMP domain-containing protein